MIDAVFVSVARNIRFGTDRRSFAFVDSARFELIVFVAQSFAFVEVVIKECGSKLTAFEFYGRRFVISVPIYYFKRRFVYGNSYGLVVGCSVRRARRNAPGNVRLGSVEQARLDCERKRIIARIVCYERRTVFFRTVVVGFRTAVKVRISYFYSEILFPIRGYTENRKQAVLISVEYRPIEIGLSLRNVYKLNRNFPIKGISRLRARG